MNAPAKIKPSRDRYIPIVRHHHPHCDGEELSLRCSILMMRDQAMSKMMQCSDEAAPILGEVHRLAMIYGYLPMPLGELKDLRYRLLQLTMAASGLEMFAYRMAHPEKRGENAGG